MAESTKDSTTGSWIKHYKPLILIPDSDDQQIPKGLFQKSYPAPATISSDIFQMMSSGASRFSRESGFEWVNKPAYQIYNGPFFTPELRRSFWPSVLKAGFPIYIVNPFCGVLWPGDKSGMYSITMEYTYWYWRNTPLWKVVQQLFYHTDSDVVISFLPPVYEGVIRPPKEAEIPWISQRPEEFPKHIDEILRLSRQQRNITHKLPQKSIGTRIKEIVRYKRE